MERDFLGLSDKQYLSNVKREADDDRVGELGLSKKAARQWGKAKFLPNSSFMPAAADFQILLAAGDLSVNCKNGPEPLITVKGLHQLHILLFLAIFHILILPCSYIVHEKRKLTETDE